MKDSPMNERMPEGLFFDFVNALGQPVSTPPLLQKNAINVHISVPCPLKVRLKTVLDAFVSQYNATHSVPIYSPTLQEGEPHSVEDVMANANHEDELPDVWVTNNYHTLFTHPFKARFIDSGIYEGMTDPNGGDGLAPQFKAVAQKHNLGFIGFGSWGMVMDQSVQSSSHMPKVWEDLVQEQYRGEIGMHGCGGHVSGTALLMVISSRLGEGAIKEFASNVRYLKHFSQIIKGMDSSDPDRARFVLMPSAAIRQIPSRKNVVQVELKDGPILTPVLLFVKKKKLAQCQDVLPFFWGEGFQQVLLKGDIFPVSQMDWSRPYSMADMDYLASHDFNELSSALDKHFQAGLPAGVSNR